MLKFYPTHHSVQRAKERVGWSRHSLVRMLERIYHTGLFQDQCRGALRDYLAACRTAFNSRLACIYGEHVYIFGWGLEPDERSLITILQLPLELRPPAHRAKFRHFHTTTRA
jgi:hypothetical protein